MNDERFDRIREAGLAAESAVWDNATIPQAPAAAREAATDDVARRGYAAYREAVAEKSFELGVDERDYYLAHPAVAVMVRPEAIDEDERSAALDRYTEQHAAVIEEYQAELDDEVLNHGDEFGQGLGY
ncbi:hypothetical protein GCM10022222_51140 [Amycolatopsis ultiminotia]|uniref:Uncharacterized protein n=1 Tax=Amycolatopsis ultiminotia TaxID=543629 RepID=A0ABP6X5C3_9PSEU